MMVNQQSPQQHLNDHHGGSGADSMVGLKLCSQRTTTTIMIDGNSEESSRTAVVVKAETENGQLTDGCILHTPSIPYTDSLLTSESSPSSSSSLSSTSASLSSSTITTQTTTTIINIKNESKLDLNYHECNKIIKSTPPIKILRSRPTIPSERRTSSPPILVPLQPQSKSECEPDPDWDRNQIAYEVEAINYNKKIIKQEISEEIVPQPEPEHDLEQDDTKPKRRRLRRPIWDRPVVEKRYNDGPEEGENLLNNNSSNTIGVDRKSEDDEDDIEQIKSVVVNNKNQDECFQSTPMIISSSDSCCSSEDESAATTKSTTTTDTAINESDSTTTIEMITTKTTTCKNIENCLPSSTYDPCSYGVIEQPEQIEPARESDDEPNKIFVGGLPWDTTEYDLEFYFGHFGKVTEINIKYDPLSCLTRGFCFITFAHEETVNAILKKPIHLIKGKLIELKRAKYRPICKKIFVGGLDPCISEQDLKAHFSQYGTVIAIETPKDRLRNRKREFSFIIFESETSVERACSHPKQFIGNRLCDVKKAQPQPICYQQKRMAQTAGMEISNTHLTKMLLGESGRTIVIPNLNENGLHPNHIPASIAVNNNHNSEKSATIPEAITPFATNLGTLLYYQTISPQSPSLSSSTLSCRSPTISSRVIPMATRPVIHDYPAYQIAADYSVNPIHYGAAAPMQTNSYLNGCQSLLHRSNSMAGIVPNQSDYYVNYYAQTAAYYAQQQQQQQLSLMQSPESSGFPSEMVLVKAERPPQPPPPPPPPASETSPSTQNSDKRNPIIGKPTSNHINHLIYHHQRSSASSQLDSLKDS